jgi:hypothetical protein
MMRRDECAGRVRREAHENLKTVAPPTGQSCTKCIARETVLSPKTHDR